MSRRPGRELRYEESPLAGSIEWDDIYQVQFNF